MFDFQALNWWAILVSTIVCIRSGSLWFNPHSFFNVFGRGQPNTDLTVYRPNTPPNMVLLLTFTVITSFVMPLFMSLMIFALYPFESTWSDGVVVGFVLWMGFVAPPYLVNNFFGGHGFKVWIIETANHLLNFLVLGAILGAWR